jgi:hypothetical protein
MLATTGDVRPALDEAAAIEGVKWELLRELTPINTATRQ